MACAVPCPRSFKDMQRWASSSASRHLCKHVAPPQRTVRSKETRHTQRAIDLSTPFGGRQDAVVPASKYQPKWRDVPKNSTVLSALSPGAHPLATSPAAAEALPWPSLASEPLAYCSSLDRIFSGRGLEGFKPEAALGRDSTFYLSYCKPRHGRAPTSRAAESTGAENRAPRAEGASGGSMGKLAAAPTAAAAAKPRGLQRPQSASVLRFYDIDHYAGRGKDSNIKVGAEGRLQTRWSNKRYSRVSAGEPFAGRAWGPIVVDVYRETRKPDEW